MKSSPLTACPAFSAGATFHTELDNRGYRYVVQDTYSTNPQASFYTRGWGVECTVDFGVNEEAAVCDYPGSAGNQQANAEVGNGWGQSQLLGSVFVPVTPPSPGAVYHFGSYDGFMSWGGAGNVFQGYYDGRVGRYGYNDWHWFNFSYDTIGYGRMLAGGILRFPSRQTMSNYLKTSIGNTPPPSDDETVWSWIEVVPTNQNPAVPTVPTTVDITLEVIPDENRHAGTLYCWGAWVPKGGSAPDFYWDDGASRAGWGIIGSAGYSTGTTQLPMTLNMGSIPAVTHAEYGNTDEFYVALVFTNNSAWVDVPTCNPAPFAPTLFAVYSVAWDWSGAITHWPDGLYSYRWISGEFPEGGPSYSGGINFLIAQRGVYGAINDGRLMTVRTSQPAEILDDKPWPWIFPPVTPSTAVPRSTTDPFSGAGGGYWLNRAQNPLPDNSVTWTDLSTYGYNDGSNSTYVHMTNTAPIRDDGYSGGPHNTFIECFQDFGSVPVGSYYSAVQFVMKIRVRGTISRTWKSKWDVDFNAAVNWDDWQATDGYVVLWMASFHCGSTQQGSLGTLGNWSSSGQFLPDGQWHDLSFTGYFYPYYQGGYYLRTRAHQAFVDTLDIAEWTMELPNPPTGVTQGHIMAATRPDGRAGSRINFLMTGT